MFKGPAIFYTDFVLFPVLAVGLLGYGQNVFGIGAGFLLFTFIEYWVHRVALHEFFYHGVHERHHDYPDEYVVFPVWYTPLIFVGFWIVLPLSIFTGMVIGMIWFIYWHHILHHFDLNSWPKSIRVYALWHLAHHNREECNYGITVPIWDYVFRTYRKV